MSDTRLAAARVTRLTDR